MKSKRKETRGKIQFVCSWDTIIYRIAALTTNGFIFSIYFLGTTPGGTSNKIDGQKVALLVKSILNHGIQAVNKIAAGRDSRRESAEGH